MFLAWFLILSLSHTSPVAAQTEPMLPAASITPLPSPHTSELPVVSFEQCPQSLIQGQFAELRMKAPVLPEGYSLRFAQQTIPFYLKRDAPQAHMGIYRTYLAVPADLKPGGYTLLIQDKQAQTLLKKSIEIRPGRFFSQNIRYRPPVLTPEEQEQVQKEEEAVKAARYSQIKAPLWKGPFSLPVPHRVNAPYGTRRYLNGRYQGYHSGVDFAAPYGYPIKAPAHAQVRLARYFSKGNSNGHTVFLDHGEGVTSVYIHLSRLAVKEGMFISQGQTLGYVGSTGRSTGPHLHWGVYLNGQNTDGLAWVRFTQQAFRNQ